MDFDLEPADLGFFFEAVEECVSRPDGFSTSSSATVPWAWQIIDGSVSLYGWIALLCDGRRAYLEYRIDSAGRGLPENLLVRTLHPSESKPALSDPAVYWFVPRHVQLALAQRQFPALVS